MQLSRDLENSFSYEMGRGWPHFTLENLDRAAGLDGLEYGFNPDKIEIDFWIETTVDKEADNLEMDIEHLRSLSNEIVVKLMPAIQETLNEFDYEGSPLVKDTIDHDFLALLVDMAIDKSTPLREVEAILQKSEDTPWSIGNLLRCVFESIILIEIFGCRKPNYRRVMGI